MQCFFKYIFNNDKPFFGLHYHFSYYDNEIKIPKYITKKSKKKDKLIKVYP
jgi:hypothetical protein